MTSYNLDKTYEGIVLKYLPKKQFGFILNHEIGEIFFHKKRIEGKKSYLLAGQPVKFKLVYAKKYPGKVAATQIYLIRESARTTIQQIQPIDNDEKFSKVCSILTKEIGKPSYSEDSKLAYDLSTPLFKLRLWIKKYVKEFDFGLFKKYHFLLHRQEAAEFKKYVKENIKEARRSDFRILSTSKLIEETEGIKTFETSWREIGFDDGRIYINIREKEPLLTSYKWAFSKADFNLIVTGYISRKDLQSIICKVHENKIIEIVGLEQLQEAIRTVERTKAKRKVDELIKEGWTPKQIREHPEFVTLRNEDLLRLFGNHNCIDYLQNLQSTSLDMPLVYIVEKRPSLNGNFTHENSYLFSILLPNNNVAIVWESVKLDRATQVFVCSGERYFEIIQNIDDFLSSFETKKRSTLKSNTEEAKSLRERLCFRASVEHTEYDLEKWKRNLNRAIPELNIILRNGT